MQKVMSDALLCNTQVVSRLMFMKVKIKDITCHRNLPVMRKDCTAALNLALFNVGRHTDLICEITWYQESSAINALNIIQETMAVTS